MPGSRRLRGANTEFKRCQATRLEDAVLTDAPQDRSGAQAFERLQACVVPRRGVAARQAITQGTRASSLHLVITGMAARDRVLGNGSRQVTEL